MESLRELHLFAGAGGGILGSLLLNHVPVCAVELEEYPRKVLLQRQRDGILPWFPIWDDIRTFDGRPWRGKADCVSGGFPCQDISTAGKGAGIDGARSGLWKEMARVVREVEPRFVWVENSPALVRRGLCRVLGDLSKLGFNAEWGIVGADAVGAKHRRKRIWILAYANGKGRRQQPFPPIVYKKKMEPSGVSNENPGRKAWTIREPGMVGMANDVAHRLDRIKAIGNGQVGPVVELAWKILSSRMNP
jgi:DNA (cytosine-5)-methyltransferase 1